MKKSKFTLASGVMACVLGCIVAGTMMPAASAQALSQEEAMKISTDAYIYGYPLVTFELTRRVLSNTAIPEDFRAPMGQFFNASAYPPVTFHAVTEPNADTLYSTAWVDLGKEPYVLSIPEMDRYHLFPMYDGWTDVIASPGTRTTGSKAQIVAVTGPNWKGKLPNGVQEVKSPVNLVWILGRIYCSGSPEDYKAVHAIQAKISLVPLSGYGKAYTPPKGNVDPSVDMKTAVRDQVNGMSGEAYFKLLATLMKGNPPSKDDAPLVAELAKIGVVPGQDFDLTKLDPVVVKAIESAPKAGVEKITAGIKTIATLNMAGVSR